MTRRDEIREKALQDLQQYEVLMLNGHFDFGNGFHGPVYLNPHQLFRYPSTIWRFAQDLLDVLPASVVDATEVVAGPVTGGALWLIQSRDFSTAGDRSRGPPRCSRR
jgi:orotate phosphoribosyltransferase